MKKHIVAFIEKYKIIVYFSSWIVMTTLSFPPFNLPLIWVSYVPLIIIIYQLSLKDIIKYGWIFGFLYYFCTMYWLIAFHELSVLFVFPILATYTALLLFLSRYISIIFPKYRMIFFPLFYTSIEIFRSIGFLGFRWNVPADSLWNQVVFLQSADLVGSFGVTFIILLVNAGIAEIFIYKDDHKVSWKQAFLKNYLKIYITLFIFLCNLSYGISSLKYWSNVIDNKLKKDRVALLQPNRPGHDSWDKNEEKLTKKYLTMTAEAAASKPDLILQTEIMIQTYLWQDLDYYGTNSPQNKYINQFVTQAKELDIPILLTHFDFDSRKKQSFNAATLVKYSNDTLITNTYHKIHIVPFGEWVPGSQNWNWLNDILSQIGAAWASPGEELTIFETAEKIKFALLICFEDLFASLGRLFVNEGAQYFVNATNDGWAYRWKIGSTVPLWQHLSSTVHTSISLRRSIARAVNTGISAVIDPAGRIDIAPLKEYTEGFYVTDIPVMPSGFRSPYTKKGWIIEYFIFFLGMFIVIFGCIKDRDNSKLKSILY